jgi:hypothetical protein
MKKNKMFGEDYAEGQDIMQKKKEIKPKIKPLKSPKIIAPKKAKKRGM